MLATIGAGRDYAQMPLRIYTALKIEARAIASRLGASRAPQVIGMRGTHFPAIDQQTTAIILAGFAGALDPALRIGDVIIDELSTMAADQFRRGRIYTSDRVVSTVAEKADLHQKTGALAVEMENAIVRDAAAAAKIPFLGIRSISDTANEALDPEILRAVDEFGNPKPAALAALLIRKPSCLVQLNRMRINSRVAAGNLAAAVEQILIGVS